MEEVDDDGPSVGNVAYNTSGVVEKDFQKIMKSEVDTDLNETEKTMLLIRTLEMKIHRSHLRVLILTPPWIMVYMVA